MAQPTASLFSLSTRGCRAVARVQTRWLAITALFAASLSVACSSDSGGVAGAGGFGAGANAGVGGTAGAASSGGAANAGAAGTSSGGSANAGTGGAGGSLGGASGSGGSAEPAVHFVGRHVRDADDTTRFGWSGTGIVVRFRGTGIAVTLDDPARYYSVVVDGQVGPRLATSPGEQEYVLAQGLADAEHVVELYRRTEGSYGSTRFFGVRIDGELLPPPAVSRRIEVLGDSITCGYGNEGPDETCDFSADTENHYLTYEALAARALGAELSTIAWSGKGVVYNYGTNVDEPLPELHRRALPRDPTSLLDLSWQPDVVVINLGTNDFSTGGDPPEALFVDAYIALLQALRADYPGALILSTLAPKLFGDDQTRAETYIQSAIAARVAAGDARVKQVDISTPSTGFGCDYHPSLATHQAMSERLISVLKQELGW